MSQIYDEIYRDRSAETGISGLDIKLLIGALLILAFCCIIIGVRIFLAAKIYHTSRAINALQTEREIILTENARLKREFEILKYRHLSGEVPDFHDDFLENSNEK